MSAQSLCDKASGVVRCSREARVFDPDGSMWCHEHAPDPAGQSSATEAGDPETWTLPGSDVLGEFMAGGRRVYNLGKAEERELFQRETGIGEIHIPEIGFSYETVARITEPGSLAITPTPLDETEPADDPVSHPTHYTSHPSGIECIDVARHMGFNLGNAVKYIWRCNLKRDAIEDLRKAVWYLQDEIAKREAEA